MAGASVNKAILLGRLGQDPEVRHTGSGKAVASFSVATDGRDDTTEWHRIVVWDKLAEQCGQYLTKGRQVYIEGRLQTRDWTDRENNRRQTTEIVAYSVQFLGGGQQGTRQNEPPPPGDRGRGQGYGSDRGQGQRDDGQGYPGDEDEDVPF